ncbi:MAG: hypothetical protein GKR89_09690 [Candidatus Latescibacteria bacterium]|nr:hypothetical protein [Candidatus Latescibacterota bacterium]
MNALKRWCCVLPLLFAVLSLEAQEPDKDLRTKEQRLYQIKLRRAQWKVDNARLHMESRQSDYEEIVDLFESDIRTLEDLNNAQRQYQEAELVYDRAVINMDQQRLSFLKDATHISIVEAVKYRTEEGYREVEIRLKNTSNLAQAVSLNPQQSVDQVSALLEVQNIRVSIESTASRTAIVDPYEIIVPSLALYQEHSLKFRLLNDDEAVAVVLHMLGGAVAGEQDIEERISLWLRKESLQDLPTINSVQFSQEGNLNSSVRFDLILERLAEDEKTFRLAVVNLPSEIDFAFLDPTTGASLTQIKFSQVISRQQFELKLEIPEQLSRRYVDQTIEFYVLVTDEEGFGQLSQLNREYGSKPRPLAALEAVRGNKERFELIPRGQGELETVIAKSYQEVKIGEEVAVRLDLLNTGTLQVERVHLLLTPPLGWNYAATPDTIALIRPGEKGQVTINLTPPQGLGVSEYDVRVEAIGYVGNELIEAQEKDITVRVDAPANSLRNVLVIGFILVLVVGVAIASVKFSRR